MPTNITILIDDADADFITALVQNHGISRDEYVANMIHTAVALVKEAKGSTKRSTFYHQHAADYMTAWNKIADAGTFLSHDEQVAKIYVFKANIVAAKEARGLNSGFSDTELAYLAACDEHLNTRKSYGTQKTLPPDIRNAYVVKIGTEEEAVASANKEPVTNILSLASVKEAAKREAAESRTSQYVYSMQQPTYHVTDTKAFSSSERFICEVTPDGQITNS